jgi:hypothetical protein
VGRGEEEGTCDIAAVRRWVTANGTKRFLASWLTSSLLIQLLSQRYAVLLKKRDGMTKPGAGHARGHRNLACSFRLVEKPPVRPLFSLPIPRSCPCRWWRFGVAHLWKRCQPASSSSLYCVACAGSVPHLGVISPVPAVKAGWSPESRQRDWPEAAAQNGVAARLLKG